MRRSGFPVTPSPVLVDLDYSPFQRLRERPEGGRRINLRDDLDVGVEVEVLYYVNTMQTIIARARVVEERGRDDYCCVAAERSIEGSPMKI